MPEAFARRLLDLISAVAPVRLDSSAFVAALAEFLETGVPDVLRALDALEQGGILIRRGDRLRIVPDVLSDSILHGACLMSNGQSTTYGEAVLQHSAGLCLTAVLRNLAELDWRFRTAHGRETRVLDEIVRREQDGTPEGSLRSRLCAAIFLIGQLSNDPGADIGVRATKDMLADLLVEDLLAGSAALRQQIPGLLSGLVDKGSLMLLGDEYRLQTRESAEWTLDFRSREAKVLADDPRIANDRATELKNACAKALQGLVFTQGNSKIARKVDLQFFPMRPRLTVVPSRSGCAMSGLLRKKRCGKMPRPQARTVPSSSSFCRAVLPMISVKP